MWCVTTVNVLPLAAFHRARRKVISVGYVVRSFVITTLSVNSRVIHTAAINQTVRSDIIKNRTGFCVR